MSKLQAASEEEGSAKQQPALDIQTDEMEPADVTEDFVADDTRSRVSGGTDDSEDSPCASRKLRSCLKGGAKPRYSLASSGGFLTPTAYAEAEKCMLGTGGNSSVQQTVFSVASPLRRRRNSYGGRVSLTEPAWAQPMDRALDASRRYAYDSPEGSADSSASASRVAASSSAAAEGAASEDAAPEVPITTTDTEDAPALVATTTGSAASAPFGDPEIADRLARCEQEVQEFKAEVRRLAHCEQEVQEVKAEMRRQREQAEAIQHVFLDRLNSERYEHRRGTEDLLASVRRMEEEIRLERERQQRQREEELTGPLEQSAVRSVPYWRRAAPAATLLAAGIGLGLAGSTLLQAQVAPTAAAVFKSAVVPAAAPEVVPVAEPQPRHCHCEVNPVIILRQSEAFTRDCATLAGGWRSLNTVRELVEEDESDGKDDNSEEEKEVVPDLQPRASQVQDSCDCDCDCEGADPPAGPPMLIPSLSLPGRVLCGVMGGAYAFYNFVSV